MPIDVKLSTEFTPVHDIAVKLQDEFVYTRSIWVKLGESWVQTFEGWRADQSTGITPAALSGTILTGYGSTAPTNPVFPGGSITDEDALNVPRNNIIATIAQQFYIHDGGQNYSTALHLYTLSANEDAGEHLRANDLHTVGYVGNDGKRRILYGADFSYQAGSTDPTYATLRLFSYSFPGTVPFADRFTEPDWPDFQKTREAGGSTIFSLSWNT